MALSITPQQNTQHNASRSTLVLRQQKNVSRQQYNGFQANITKVPRHKCLRFLRTAGSNPGIPFSSQKEKKTSKERIDSEKVLGSSQNMKGEIVSSMECNSTNINKISVYSLIFQLHTCSRLKDKVELIMFLITFKEHDNSQNKQYFSLY